MKEARASVSILEFFIVHQNEKFSTAVCHFPKKIGHIVCVCIKEAQTSAASRPESTPQGQTHDLTLESQDQEENFLDHTSADQLTHRTALHTTQVIINTVLLMMEVDSGSACSLIRITDQRITARCLEACRGPPV